MAYIPTITNQIDAVTGLPNTQASSADFGGLAGQALSGVGRDIAGAGRDILDLGLREKQKLDAANVANARAGVDYTPRQLELQKNYVPGTGPVQAAKDISNDYDTWADAQVNGMTNLSADQRRTVRADLALRKPTVTSSQAVYAAAQDGAYNKDGATAALDTVINKVRNSPDTYSQSLQDGLAVIDARPDLPASQKEVMKNTFRSDVAMSKFQSMMGAATSAEDIDAITKQLVDGSPGAVDPVTGKASGKIDWTKQFDAKTYSQVIDGLRIARSSIGTKVDADTRAALTSIRERSDKIVAIDPAEMDATEKLVVASHNPILQSEFYSIKVKQALYDRERGLPTAELQSRNNQQSGGPGMMPGLPPEVSQGAQDASALTNGKVSAAYLAGTAQREYGQNFKRVGGGTVDGKFAPIAAGTGDIRDLQPQVSQGLAIAGQVLGHPITVFSGYRSAEHQKALRDANPGAAAAGRIAGDGSKHIEGNAVDISTVGMSGADKAQLVDSLVQAGFTGFGEYTSHIHADFRDKTPDKVDLGAGFGGWTSLSPEVAAALQKRGYAAGLEAAKIDRRGADGTQPAATPVQWSVDYGRGTDITDTHGRPTSGALGLAQFTPGTWLETLKNGGAERMGIDVRGKTEQELLDLRKDPSLAMKGAAILAQRNQADLAAGLGRDPSDPELYMAHMLGSNGAVALIKTYKNNPSAIARDVLPGAAASNRPVFYHNGQALTVGEVYNQIATTFGAAPGRGGFAEIEARQTLINRQKEGVKGDQVSFANNDTNGRFVMPPLTEDAASYQQRGKDMEAFSQFYNVPSADLKPFSDTELAAKTKTLQDGSAEDKLAELQRIEAMPGKVAAAALKQLGKDNPTFEQAGALAASGSPDVATTVLRGDARRSDPGYKAASAGLDEAAAKDFYAYAGAATSGLRPEDSNKILQAAIAHYAETTRMQSDHTGQAFNATTFRKSVDAVSGGVGQVNGANTVLPKGVDASTFDSALDSMTPSDLLRLSVDGSPPVTRDGDPIGPKDLANEGKFEALGGNVYNVRLADDGYVLTPDGNKYRMQLDSKTVTELAGRPSRPVQGPPASAALPPPPPPPPPVTRDVAQQNSKKGPQPIPNFSALPFVGPGPSQPFAPPDTNTPHTPGLNQ